MGVAPFFVDFHHFLSIFTIFYRFSRFTHFCCDLHFVAIYALFFGQNSHLRNITRFLHVWSKLEKSQRTKNMKTCCFTASAAPTFMSMALLKGVLPSCSTTYTPYITFSNCLFRQKIRNKLVLLIVCKSYTCCLWRNLCMFNKKALQQEIGFQSSPLMFQMIENTWGGARGLCRGQ